MQVLHRGAVKSDPAVFSRVFFADMCVRVCVCVFVLCNPARAAERRDAGVHCVQRAAQQGQAFPLGRVQGAHRNPRALQGRVRATLKQAHLASYAASFAASVLPMPAHCWYCFLGPPPVRSGTCSGASCTRSGALRAASMPTSISSPAPSTSPSWSRPCPLTEPIG